jgi:hypothetical protein
VSARLQALLSRLDGVRRVGSNRWVARCPAHDDRNPSLSIRELDDGRILIHDFALCAVDQILAAIGLDIASLFPERLGDRFVRERRPFPASDVLRCLSTECEIVAIAADNLAHGLALTDADRDRVRLASIRIRAGQEFAGG